MARPRWSRRSLLLTASVVVAVCLAMGLTVWITYRALVEWQQTARELATRRAVTAVDLLVTALARDMSAVQISVLSDTRAHELPSSPDAIDLVSSAFARYPYPEAFFAWHASPPSVVFYSRSDRYPSWMASTAPTPSPVTVVTNPVIGQQLVSRVKRDADLGRQYATFNMTFGGSNYQIVAQLSYHDAFREHLKDVFGFMVNLDWVRDHYFRDVSTQVARISGADKSVALMIVDSKGRTIVNVDAGTQGPPVGRRQFAILFFDRRVVAVDWPPDLGRESWTAQAVISRDPALLAADAGARRTLVITATTVLVLALAVMLSAWAMRATTQLAEMRAEFVSTVTHELKTPIATIQAISETFATDRGITPEISRKHGRLALNETKRLRRLVDNLLAYARITDVTEAYYFQPLAVHALVTRTLRDFTSQLEYGNFEVHVDVPSDLPRIKGHQAALSFALGNLMDNAIRYSRERRQLSVKAHRNGNAVIIEVADKGIGIADDEMPNITRKFFRGRRVDLGGSGLGLAIVDRIVAGHNGVLRFESVIGQGTKVSIGLPLAEEGNDEARANR